MDFIEFDWKDPNIMTLSDFETDWVIAKPENRKFVETVINRVFTFNESELPTIEWLSNYINFDRYWMKNENFSKYTSSFDIRHYYTKYCFPILNHEFFQDLKFVTSKFNNIAELGAGTGWFSYWARKYNINVKDVIDDYSWKDTIFGDRILDIVTKQDNLEYLKSNNPNLIIYSWPYMDESIANVYRNMKIGTCLLYIGEDRGGCTANDEFFHLISNNILEDETNYLNRNWVSYNGIHDSCKLILKN